MDIAKMIHTLSKAPTHTLYLTVPESPGGSAGMWQLRYRERKAMITCLGEGKLRNDSVWGVQCLPLNNVLPNVEVDVSKSDIKQLLVAWANSVNHLCYERQELNMALLSGKCERHRCTPQTHAPHLITCMGLRTPGLLRVCEWSSTASLNSSPSVLTCAMAEAIMIGARYCGQLDTESFPLVEGSLQ